MEEQGVSLNDLAATNPDTHILEQLAAIFRRRWKPILLFVLAGLVLGALYAESQPPQYAASATVMVRSGFAVDPVRQGIQTTTPEEEGQFLSQMELVKSSSVAALVASRLNLEEDPAFAKSELSGYKRLIARLEGIAGIKTGLARSAAQITLERDAIISRLQSGVKALRAGRTYVAAISYTHADPAVAQKVAQAFAEAFRQKLAEASDLANSRARAMIEAELAKATGEAKLALEQKYQDVIIARALPGMDAVIISDAKKPGAPIAPRKPFLLAVGTILGAALGCLFAGWREMRDRGVRDGDMLARRLRIRFLGYLPAVAIERKPGSTNGNNLIVPEGARLSITDPFSRFGETVRAAAVAGLAGSKGEGRVIAITSTLPGEGKTVFAANLAAHFGNQGRKVLLIDGDFRHPELSDWLAGRTEHGVIDTLLQNKPLVETALYESRSNITFLPTGLNDRTVEPAGLLAGAQMRALIAEQRSQHDVVVLDLPSLTTAADARAAEPLVDAYILLAEWGGPSPALIETILAGETEVAAKTAGLVISKTELRKLPLYATSASRGAYQKRIG
jgi:Mrp family chromosome partitioning ATPase/capsular polysaccharide biosynthesis protein